MSAPRKYLVSEETAALLRKSPNALRQLVHRGAAPPSIKVGARRLWLEQDVYDWLDAQAAADTTAEPTSAA